MKNAPPTNNPKQSGNAFQPETTGRRQHRLILLAAVSASVLLLTALARKCVDDTTLAADAAAGHIPDRIVSFSPSLTEILFAIDCGDRVVGVTDFCKYPAAAADKPSIGGLFNPNYEAIAALEPDVVVLLAEHEKSRRRIEQLGFRTVTVDHDTLDGILASISQLGELCGSRRQARMLKQSLETRLARVAAATRGADRPRVLITAGREDAGSGSISSVFIAGKGNFYTQLLTYAGGANAYAGPMPLPSVSREGIMEMAPEVIVEMLGDLAPQGVSAEKIIRDWDSLPGIPAVQNGRVFLFTDSNDVVPGPRIVKTLEKLAACLHPELFPGPAEEK